VWMQVQQCFCSSRWWCRHAGLLSKSHHRLSWRCRQSLTNYVHIFTSQNMSSACLVHNGSCYSKTFHVLVIYHFRLEHTHSEIFIRIYDDTSYTNWIWHTCHTENCDAPVGSPLSLMNGFWLITPKCVTRWLRKLACDELLRGISVIR
jgi:hypothetical protein